MTSRVVIYARVSTRDQEPENQLLALREYAGNRGWMIAGEFVDAGISGGREQRPQLTRLLESVRRRKCDIVLVWRFDRFARSSRHLLNTLEEFRSLEVSFVSFQEAIDTTTPSGKMVFSMVAAIAEFERSLIRERILAGLSRARAQGKQLGRPRKQVDASQVVDLHRQGRSLRQIARQMVISKEMARRVLAAQNGSENSKPASVGA